MIKIKSLIIFILNISFIAQVLAADAPTQNTISAQKLFGFADIVEPLIPAVVNVYSLKYNKGKVAPFNPFDGFPFDQFNNFFEQFDNNNSAFEETYSNPKAISLGSGFITDPTGYIVTNYHVIRNADEINVKLNDNTELPAKVIGSDQKTDLALLKVEPKKLLPFVKFGDTNKARVGDLVFAIGNPFGFGGTVTSGIISSKGRDISDDGGIVDNFIQTDASINAGNSGGPLFNVYGEVIGINTAIFSPSGTNVGIGFAIPSSTAQNVIEELKKHGKISRGKLDISIQEITPELAEGLGLKDQAGVLVVEVSPGGAAHKAGIKAGDVITEFNGEQVKNSRKLQILVAEAPVNKEIKVSIIRNDKKEDLVIKIDDKEATAKKQSKDSFAISGITFSDINNEIRQKFSIKEKIEGVLVTSVAKNEKHYGLRVGDLVLALNQQHIINIDQFKKAYDTAKRLQKKNVVLLVKRYGTHLFIPIPVM